MYFFSFIYGIVAALGALLLQVAVNSTLNTHNFLLADNINATAATALILLFASMEEMFKFVAVIKGLHYPPRLYSTFFHAFFVGCGFIAIEYSTIALTPYDNAIAVPTAALGTFIIHICTPLIFAAFLVTLKHAHRLVRIAVPLIVTILLHASYNILALTHYAPSSPPQLFLLSTITLFALTAVFFTIFIDAQAKKDENTDTAVE